MSERVPLRVAWRLDSLLPCSTTGTCKRTSESTDVLVPWLLLGSKMRFSGSEFLQVCNNALMWLKSVSNSWIKKELIQLSGLAILQTEVKNVIFKCDFLPPGLYVHVPDPNTGGLDRCHGPNSCGSRSYVGSSGCYLLHPLPSFCYPGKSVVHEIDCQWNV